ncbi:MAG: hypothetical protein ACKOJF_07185 [Planctomycetaceae bacterium]
MSNAANIAEGNGRFTRPDRRSFLALPLGRSMNVAPCWRWPNAAVFWRDATPRFPEPAAEAIWGIPAWVRAASSRGQLNADAEQSVASGVGKPGAANPWSEARSVTCQRRRRS